jgi:hypothetical protein
VKLTTHVHLVPRLSKTERTHSSTPLHDVGKDDFYYNKKLSNREILKPFLLFLSFFLSLSPPLSLSFLPYLPFFPCLHSLLRLFSPYFLSFFPPFVLLFFSFLSSCRRLICISYNLIDIHYSHPTVHQLTTKSLPMYQNRGFVAIHT